MILATTRLHADIEIKAGKKKEATIITLDLHEMVEVRGWKAIGNKLPQTDVIGIELLPGEEGQENNTGLENNEEKDGGEIAPVKNDKPMFKPAFDERMLEAGSTEEPKPVNIEEKAPPQGLKKSAQLKFLF